MASSPSDIEPGIESKDVSQDNGEAKVFKSSRFIGLVDVPEVETINSNFIYNFFVPDERIDDSGAPRFQGALKKQTTINGQVGFIDNTQKAVDSSVLASEMPRFVRLDWVEPNLYNSRNLQDMSEGNVGFLEQNQDSINSESTMTSFRDGVIQTRDIDLRKRLRQKIVTYAKLKGVNSVIPKDVLEVFSDKDHMDSSIADDLLQGFLAPELSQVNEIRQVKETVRFLDASRLTMHSFVDRKLGKSIFNSIFSKKADNISLIKDFDDDFKENYSFLSIDASSDSLEPNVVGYQFSKVDAASADFASTLVGYVVERRTMGNVGLFDEKTADFYFIDGHSKTTFIDTRVLYDQAYSYTVKAVYALEFTLEIADDPTTTAVDAGFYRIRTLVSSKRSKSTNVTCVERIPPVEPDGVLYRFNYGAGRGMLINWQMPVGTQRDIKYFQVFRRRNIKEPFTCIAEIDFDDSVVRAPRPEKVREDRIFKYKFPRTFFSDNRFDRDSKFIYAVATVDAHGLTSGYSAQTEVGFNRVKNEIMLKTISRPGAPKQYPNFYIDPTLDDNFTVDSLTTDAMLSSKKHSVKIYFDPDALNVTKATPDGSTVTTMPVVTSLNKSNTKYVLSLLNVDRQKSADVEFSIINSRNKLQLNF